MGTLTRGFSADVRMELIINERTFQLSQLGPNQIKLQDAVEVPTGEGEIRLYVDGVLRPWKVQVLPAQPGTRWVGIERMR